MNLETVKARHRLWEQNAFSQSAIGRELAWLIGEVERLQAEADRVRTAATAMVKGCCGKENIGWCESYGCTTLVRLVGLPADLIPPEAEDDSDSAENPQRSE